MQVIICDDEPVYLEALQNFVACWASDKHRSILIKTFQSSEDLLDAWENGLTIDLVFMDIQIPGEISGMELARLIHSQDEYISIVFETNYDEYACDGYCVNAIRYLKKPLSQKDISICMDIAWRRWQCNHEHLLALSANSQSIHIPTNVILYAEAVKHKVRIVTTDSIGIYEIRFSLEQLEKKLPSDTFFRCHKSFMVHARYIRKYKSGWIFLASGEAIPVGRKYSVPFTLWLQSFYQAGSNNVDDHRNHS